MNEDNQTNPTEQEPDGTPIEVGEVSAWGDDVNIVEPNLASEDGEVLREEPNKEEAETETEAETEATTEDINQDVDNTPNIVENLPTDPGDFQPKDYSFEVTIFDADGKNGKTVTIKSVEQFDELLEKDVNFGSGSALMKASRQAAAMEQGQLRDKEEYDQRKQDFDQAVEAANTRTAEVNSWVNEINYLADEGVLPPVDAKYEDADWSDPTVAKQPGVKERIELLNYMRDENNKRIKAGLPPMRSVIDAHNDMELKKIRKGEQETAAKRAQARKAAGSRVASNSPNPVSVAPKGISVGRGGSLDDLTSGWS